MVEHGYWSQRTPAGRALTEGLSLVHKLTQHVYTSLSLISVCVCVEANVSLQLTVDPLRPRAIPECAFLGPDQGEWLMPE